MAAPELSVVGVLVRLRYRVLWNSLRRSIVLRAAVILGALQALALVGIAILTAVILQHKALPVERESPWIVIGSIVTLGWVIAPLIVGGAEPTLDPRKLARFPISANRILAAELLVGVAWVPGAATLVGALSAALTWADRPAAAWTSVGCAVLVLLTCVIASRAATSLAAELVARRGAAGRLLATLVAAIVLLAPVGIALALNWPPWRRFDGLVDALALTPTGAAWAVPGYAADRRWDMVVASLAVALATIVVLLAAWRLGLDAALRTRGSSGRRQHRGRLGPFAIAPTGAVGAITARSLVLWARDPRLVVQLVIVPAVPALLVVLGIVEGISWFGLVAAPVAAGLLPLAQFAGISYDGTAFASEIAAATRGRADRIGRAGGLLAIGGPIVLAVALLAPLAVGSPERIPAVVGLSLAALLTALGVASVSSAIVVVPVPASGRNPFSAPPGANTTQVVGSYVVTGVTGVALAPVIVLGAFALVTGSPVLGWATLAGGLLWGAGALVAGIAIGGRLLDDSAPELLARMRRMRMR